MLVLLVSKTVAEEETEMYIDLHPITNASPYTAVETASLAKATMLFREVGLRHMCVVPKSRGVSISPSSFPFPPFPRILLDCHYIGSSPSHTRPGALAIS